MKLTYKGVYKDVSQLPESILPENSTKFVEPSDPKDLSKQATKFLLFALLLALLTIIASMFLSSDFTPKKLYDGRPIFYSLIAPFLTILPHECLHAICFGKDANVELFIIPKQLTAFVTCPKAISKSRFIFMSMLPNMVFGWIPFILWAILPYNPNYSSFLFQFSFICITFGAGDYLNTYNAIKQMPKGSMQQLAGFNSYWFMPVPGGNKQINLQKKYH